ncbi:unnamed protein product, partial [Ascophyllum nodosum]
RFDNVGYIKPVGQQHEKTSEGILVDKARSAMDLSRRETQYTLYYSVAYIFLVLSPWDPY